MKDMEIKTGHIPASIPASDPSIHVAPALPTSPQKKKQKWLEVVPHGLVGGMIPNLCLMIFKEKSGSHRFAISLPPLQGKIALNQSLNREEPFRFISTFLDTMGVRVEKCYFLNSDKGVVLAQLIISGHPTVRSLKLVASDVVPFVVYTGCPFFCTKKFISEVLDQKIEQQLKTPIKKPMYPN